jgi:hypothetical protein
VLRTYQPLAHAVVALVYFALGKSVALMKVFVWVRFLSVVLLPLSFFAAARLMGLRPITAAAAAMLALLHYFTASHARNNPSGFTSSQ